MGALEERRSITLAPNQLVKLLNLVTELDREGVRLEFADVTDGLHTENPLCALADSLYGTAGTEVESWIRPFQLGPPANSSVAKSEVP